jgi:predicted lipoprotein with Yx(FWY)xxD motif
MQVPRTASARMPRRAWAAGLVSITAALAALAGALALTAGSAGASSRSTVHVGVSRSARLHETILVNAHGRTLYHLKPESARHIICTGACAKLWPPLLVPSRSARLLGSRAVRGRLSIVRRPDGKLQAALDGMPLYTFARDHRAGDVNGQGFDGVWFVLVQPTAHHTTGGGIPQHNGGDMDADNNGAPSDGDGNR